MTEAEATDRVDAYPVTCFPVRLRPGEEIKSELLNVVKKEGLQGAFVMSCVGSVTKAVLRMSDSTTVKTFEGHFEIVSLVGTLSAGGHLHISLSDVDGHVFGGHVMGDLVVFTTAEVVIGNAGGVVFTREPDSQTGYNELVINPYTT
ncbi:bifunctional protein GlmU-like isoform X2 [Pecten maximus]|uniref:bifunctional protein GlmU-like isoform X2 n=1 Tax=Pecten maximus TaxID=6579 RepID=UPI00145848B4|nr:bifunctional protein GlmU-like isoform X2 [Pecten maximus]